MMRTLNAQLLKSFLILEKCFPMELGIGRIEKMLLLPLLKGKVKAFTLTCSSSTPCGFMSTQTMWNSLRWVLGSSPISSLNIDKRCINPDLNSKLALLLMFMHNGWFSIFGAMSSLSVCFSATAMLLLMRAFFRNLRKVFYISRSTCTCSWSVNRVADINSRENSNKLKEINHKRD